MSKKKNCNRLVVALSFTLLLSGCGIELGVILGTAPISIQHFDNFDLTIIASQDAYTQKINADVNYGKSYNLASKLSESDYRNSREINLQFDVSDIIDISLPETFTARLFIHQYLSGAIGSAPLVDVHLTESNWSEYNLTWNNKPARRDVSTKINPSFDSLNNANWLSVPIESFITTLHKEGGDRLSIAISNPKNNDLIVTSKEYQRGIFAPYIRIYSGDFDDTTYQYNINDTDSSKDNE